MVKAAPLLEAIEGRFASGSPRPVGSGPAPARLGPRPVPRPQPSAGVFETLLVAYQRPLALGPHLERLAESLGALYDCELPAGLEQELLAAAWGLEAARLRVDARPSDEGVSTEIIISPLRTRSLPVLLCPISVPGGLGAHKWIDRGLIETLGGQLDGDPLLCDLDGLVLESARANVFLVERGPRVLTPPLDGRILPGVARAAVIELARSLGLEVRVEPVELERLQQATEIFVTGSLGGVEPAVLARGGGRALDGATVTAGLASAWRARAQELRPGAARLPA